jgi:hypothetical protein
MPAVTLARSSTRRPANEEPAGTSTRVALLLAHTLAAAVGRVGVAVGGWTSK